MVLGLPLWAITCLLGSSEGPDTANWSFGASGWPMEPLDSHFGLQNGHSEPLEGHLGHLDGHFLGLLDNYLGSLALWAHSIGP